MDQDFKIALTSVQIEPVAQYIPVSSEENYLDFAAKFRLEGACYCSSPQERSYQARNYLLRWLEDNLLHRYDTMLGHEGSWGGVQKIGFMVFFEDESDAILFFLTFK